MYYPWEQSLHTITIEVGIQVLLIQPHTACCNDAPYLNYTAYWVSVSGFYNLNQSKEEKTFLYQVNEENEIDWVCIDIDT